MNCSSRPGKDLQNLLNARVVFIPPGVRSVETSSFLKNNTAQNVRACLIEREIAFQIAGVKPRRNLCVCVCVNTWQQCRHMYNAHCVYDNGNSVYWRSVFFVQSENAQMFRAAELCFSFSLSSIAPVWDT